MTYRKPALLLLMTLASATCVMAQTPPADQTAPSAASSPHQRDATSTPAAEAPATPSPEASATATPHQKEVTGADKTKHQQMMKDCVAKEQAKNSATSMDDAKKACMSQMKKTGSQAQ
jgi:hypothetical protein